MLKEHPRKSLLFFVMIRTGIDLILHEYPVEIDEYLDWYNRRKGLYDTFEEGAIKIGYKSSFSNREEFMRKQFDTLLATKTSWESLKSSFKL